jgi:hypothetical protein
MKTREQNAVFFIYSHFIILVLLFALPVSTWAGGSKENKENQPQTVQPSAVAISPMPVYWTGDGGKGKSITILPPRGVGIAANQAYLPDFVANELVSNFSTYSGMTLFDRVNNEKQYKELLSGLYDDNDAASLDLGHLASTDYMLLGDITRTSTGFALQLTVNKNSDKTTVASYSGTVSVAELDNLSGVRQASLDLLQKLGVQLTAQARTELSGAAVASHVSAQAAMAQGITAQRQGTVVEALSRYIQANNYDPSLAEAASRLNILTASVTSGNIGEDVRNDIQWRRQWTERLQETESFFANYTKEIQPYYLIYNTDIKQGEINYQNETVELNIWMGLLPETTWINTINEVMNTVKTGLAATGRTGTWGLDWPSKSIGATSPFQDNTKTYAVVVEIVNSDGKSIGRQTVTMRYGYYAIYPTYDSRGNTLRDGNRATGFITPAHFGQNVSIPAVNANLITDRLTIRIISIDGIVAESASGQKKVSIMPEAEYNQIPAVRADGMDNISRFEMDRDNRRITGYTGSGENVIIPVIYNEIRWGVFSEKGITSITIPNSITFIGSMAFSGNQLTSVTISSVTFIGTMAFSRNPLTSVTIDANVGFEGSDAIPDGFVYFYNNNGKKAGTYTYSNKNWSCSVQ